ncbi:MAG: agmatine deiminase family protein [Bryobacteraceae bacterium]
MIFWWNLRRLRSEDRTTRALAAAALGASRDPRAVDALVDAMRDKSISPRHPMIEALGDTGDQRALPALREHLNSGPPHHQVYVVKAIQKIGGEAARDALIEALDSGSHEARRAAADALELGGWAAGNEELRLRCALVREDFPTLQLLGAAAVEPLVAMLREALPNKRVRAAVALGEIGDSRAIAPLSEALGSPEPELRRAAELALAKIAPPRAAVEEKRENQAAPAAAATPSTLGFSMPAEWEPHEATWLAWPHNPTDWPDKLDTIRWVYGEIVRKITPGEGVRLLVASGAQENQARRQLARAGAETARVEFIQHPTNRGWTRDSGPVFVKRKGETAIIHFHFNGWAKYPDWQQDRRVPEVAAARLGKRLFEGRLGETDLILEGGGIEVNGRGTLITTEECYLDPTTQVRNPGYGRREMEAALRENLGVSNVFWLGGGVAGDDTHGHVDDICRFVNPTTVVLARESNPGDVNYLPLEENWERIKDLRLEDGSKPEVAPLPMPAPIYFDGDRLPASYANFYIANAAVLVPTFNDPNDRVALGILQELIPDRPVVGIHAVDLVLGFGTLHCLTQQQPAE